MMMQKPKMRWAAIALALGLGVVACTTPTTTELEMGQQVRLTLPMVSGTTETEDELARLARGVVATIQARGDMEVATVELRGGDTTATVELVVWGDHLDGDALVRDLVAQHPVLRSAEVEVLPLLTELREPLYAKLSREVLKLEIGGGSDEEIRTRVLEQLHAGGYGEGSAVQVWQEDGVTTLQINAVGDGIEQETVIEVIGDSLPESIELGGADGTSTDDRVIIERVKKQ